jgi:hypothetical protein
LGWVTYGSSRLSVHLACALLAHFANQVRTLSILRLAPFPSAQIGRKTQHLHPICTLCFLRWNHTRRFCGAFYHQLLLDSDLTIFILPNKQYYSFQINLIFLPLMGTGRKSIVLETVVSQRFICALCLRPTVLNPKISIGRCSR